MQDKLHLHMIGYNIVLHKPNGDVDKTGSISIVSKIENQPDTYEVYTENGYAIISITESQLKQLTWKETLDVYFIRQGESHPRIVHFYKVGNRS